MITQVRAAQITDPTLLANGTISDLLAYTDAAPAAISAKNITVPAFYDAKGRLIATLDGAGYLTENEYDPADNLTKVIRYDRVLSYTFGLTTLANLKTAASGAATQTRTLQYDEANRLTQERDFQGTVTTFQYDRVGNLISQTRAQGQDPRTTQTRYDAMGRIKQTLSAEGASRLVAGLTQAQIDTIWDNFGTTFQYDLVGRLTQTTQKALDPNTNAIQVLTTLNYYNEDGQLRFQVNGLGERKEFRYNALNQLTDTITYYNRLSATTTSTLTGGALNQCAHHHLNYGCR